MIWEKEVKGVVSKTPGEKQKRGKNEQIALPVKERKLRMAMVLLAEERRLR